MNIATVFLIIAGILLGAAGMFWWIGREGKKRKNYLLIYDGAYRLVPCKPSPGGIEYDGVTYPAVQKLSLNEQDYLYVLPIRPIDLIQHETLDRLKGNILKGRMFKPGGDIVAMLQQLGAALMIALSLWLGLSINNFNGVLATIRAEAQVTQGQLSEVTEILSRPLQIEQGEK